MDSRVLLQSLGRGKNNKDKTRKGYAAPIGAFFCPEIRAFTGFWGEISSTASRVLSDRKVLLKHKMAVNSR